VSMAGITRFLFNKAVDLDHRAPMRVTGLLTQTRARSGIREPWRQK
jgi:hypothetical protein